MTDPAVPPGGSRAVDADAFAVVCELGESTRVADAGASAYLMDDRARLPSPGSRRVMIWCRRGRWVTRWESLSRLRLPRLVCLRAGDPIRHYGVELHADACAAQAVVREISVALGADRCMPGDPCDPSNAEDRPGIREASVDDLGRLGA